MRSSMRGGVAAAALLCLVFLAAACDRRSPEEKVLAERARWDVQALNWAQSEDHAIVLATRVSGPANAGIETLTVEIQLQDATGNVLESHWHSFDLTAMPRGGPEDFTLTIEASGPVDGLGIVPPRIAPTEEDRAHIVELQGL